MLGVNHALSGAVLGLAVAGFGPQVFGAGSTVTAGSVLTFAGVTAGAALLPDLDHPSSMATKRFSAASWLASRLIRPLSALVYNLTRSDGDDGTGTHRGLTHTVLGAALVGAAVNLASAEAGTPVLVGTLFACLALAIKGLDDLVPGPPSLVIAAGLTVAVERYVPGGTVGTAGWLGLAVTIGMVVHMVGDALTESGAPLLWPLRIKQRRWYPVGNVRPLRFRTGGPAEVWLIAPALTVAVLVLAMTAVPGVDVVLGDVIAAARGG